jgi:hypothetical protein
LHGKQQRQRPNRGHADRTAGVVCAEPDQPEKEAAEDRPEHADGQIAGQAKALALREFAGQPAAGIGTYSQRGPERFAGGVVAGRSRTPGRTQIGDSFTLTGLRPFGAIFISNPRPVY